MEWQMHECLGPCAWWAMRMELSRPARWHTGIPGMIW